MAKKDKDVASLPKRLAGVKIPKTVRENLIKLAKNPMVADLLAAGLVALAARLRDEPKVKKPGKAKAKSADAKDEVAEAAEIATAVAAKPVKAVRKAPGAPAKPASAPPKAPVAAKPAAARKPANSAGKTGAARRPATKPPRRPAPKTTH